MKISNYASWNRTSDLPICSAVPLPLRYRGYFYKDLSKGKYKCDLIGGTWEVTSFGCKQMQQNQHFHWNNNICTLLLLPEVRRHRFAPSLPRNQHNPFFANTSAPPEPYSANLNLESGRTFYETFEVLSTTRPKTQKKTINQSKIAWKTWKRT